MTGEAKLEEKPEPAPEPPTSAPLILGSCLGLDLSMQGCHYHLGKQPCHPVQRARGPTAGPNTFISRPQQQAPDPSGHS